MPIILFPQRQEVQGVRPVSARTARVSDPWDFPLPHRKASPQAKRSLGTTNVLLIWRDGFTLI
jgi:hypothetical protein